MQKKLCCCPAPLQILVNDVAIGYDFEPLAKYICAAYSGPNRHVTLLSTGGLQ